MTSRPRPLSPHLQIYRWSVTMAMSILQRVTGVALYGGTLVLVVWLVAAAWGPEQLALVNGFLAHWFGQIVLFGFSFALIHHLLGGIRYLIWDRAVGMDKPQRGWIATANIVGSVALTVIAWAIFVGTNWA